MSETPPRSHGRGRPAKRDAIVLAARAVFGRDGYARTTMDTIAREAEVSTRTLYKHFGSKEELFSFVLEQSANRVADAFCEYVTAGLEQADGVAEQLIAIGRALVAHRLDFPDHFALVRQINAEGRHFPRAMLDAWQQAGPLRVQAEVVRRLQALVDRGDLRAAAPERMALHFTALTTFESTNASTERTLTADEISTMVRDAVHAFRHGYQPAT
ncbi:TetR/AcrR family transcriptional regulator [Micromonospora sp. WMMD1128]|uniref:TetR/AcrR family transcriptional regulator n=1 Tax=Micromonospora sp. WMMD1128 TaxID=3015150 RepID=UPI00248CCC44|nr:TetR/AcrR family transcriptional regulator [Micromonospora sp. WMMD1128]WBB73458.1 TetR/AcrR family transcriptional regulator [Micromonospora sp. WMMD1128]